MSSRDVEAAAVGQRDEALLGEFLEHVDGAGGGVERAAAMSRRTISSTSKSLKMLSTLTGSPT